MRKLIQVISNNVQRNLSIPQGKQKCLRAISTSSHLNGIDNNKSNQDQDLVTCSLVHDDKIAVVTFNAPVKLNAMSVGMGKAFKSTIESLCKKNDLRSVVLTGEGKAFSAGGDLDWLIERHEQSDKKEENSETMVQFYKMFLSLRDIPCPVIAAINGHAVGAGCCVALGGCDIRIASPKAKMGFNFVKIGLHPGMAATHFLPNLVGPSTAASLLLTGKLITAEEALHCGLVSEVCDDPKEAALKLAEEIADNSGPIAVRTLVTTLREKQNQGLAEAMKRESEAQAETYATKDFLEGVTATKEKRAPTFKAM